MIRYPTKPTKETGIGGRNTYPAVRPDFPYVVLTRETGLGPGKFRG